MRPPVSVIDPSWQREVAVFIPVSRRGVSVPSFPWGGRVPRASEGGFIEVQPDMTSRITPPNPSVANGRRSGFPAPGRGSAA